ncbi:fungal-specific transcription factor domain-domain-containing protein [Microdochium bolleyi]|uniref:Fungal-specific transcription factor domain-domain-containing protein n=1 Tax=Microdochium bolleyi TaxID=196109 RepID=A0A136IWT7_9PEZI|nr:fungal-specific transcription factor domain-domain-containing protein [Microdochium bolleyi]
MSASPRTSHLKSRNGCLRCKSRKVKCDERKPACQRCEGQNVQCPGYALNVRWSHRHQRQAGSGPSRPTSTAVWNDLLPQDGWPTPPTLPAPKDSAVTVLSPSSAASWASIQNSWMIGLDDSDLSMTLFDPLAATEGAAEATRPVALFGRRSLSPSPAREISHLPTALSQYFFSDVISLYCSWDSKSNIMRGIVETRWQSSSVLNHTIQSMAAACLSEDFPQMLAVARREHDQAMESIRADFPSSTTGRKDILLAYMLLGHTASWLAPQNLATDRFRASWNMLGSIMEDAPDDNAKTLSFFSDTMEYWAMLLVFLTDRRELGNFRRRPGAAMIGPSPSASASDTAGSIDEPHPYSGISRETVKLLTDTGILVFGYRTHMAKVRFMAERDLDIFRAALRDARRLERSFLAHVSPDLVQLRDPGDPQTPLEHLRLIDEAYRCTGLLQLYRVFPDLLSERYTPWCEASLLSPAPGSGRSSITPEERQAWLTKLALHVLGILQNIPFESRTRSVQPFIMVAVSSELRRKSAVCNSDRPRLGYPTISGRNSGDPTRSSLLADGPALDRDEIEVVKARKFIRARLAAYSHVLPLNKVQVISELLKAVWAALDRGEEEVYWVDIARDKGLRTMMG